MCLMGFQFTAEYLFHHIIHSGRSFRHRIAFGCLFYCKKKTCSAFISSQFFFFFNFELLPVCRKSDLFISHHDVLRNMTAVLKKADNQSRNFTTFSKHYRSRSYHSRFCDDLGNSVRVFIAS